VFTERTSVGLDVHARSVAAAAIDGVTGELFQAKLTPSHERAWLGDLPGPVAVAYEVEHRLGHVQVIADHLGERGPGHVGDHCGADLAGLGVDERQHGGLVRLPLGPLLGNGCSTLCPCRPGAATLTQRRHLGCIAATGGCSGWELKPPTPHAGTTDLERLRCDSAGQRPRV
jgi:hypothetical protein